MRQESDRSSNWRIAGRISKALLFLSLLVWLITLSCVERSIEGLVLIVMEAEGDAGGGSVLALVDPDRPEKEPRVLTSEFFTAAAPEISYDGNSVVFQAQTNPEDPWQIWEYNFEEDEFRRVTRFDLDCKDPAYLPNGRIVYTRFEDDFSGYHVLETCDPDGTEVRQITFAPVDYRSPAVLMDGRVLAWATEVYPQPKEEQLMVMRPDGTKIELYLLNEGVPPVEAGQLDPVFAIEGYDILESRPVASRLRPKKLPSEVNLEAETALLVCMDARVTDLPEQETDAAPVRVELLGLKGSLGMADLEEDGSVYLKIKADTPFRMQTLDEEGNLIQGPSSWLQLRPNERRGCVGCHAGHTRAPDNRQPLAVQKEPVEIPLYEEAIMAGRYSKKTSE